jgi:AraC-like DNA-binding protein
MKPVQTVFLIKGGKWRAISPGDLRLRNVTVGTAALRTLVPNAEDLVGPPPRPGPALRLLDGYLRSLAVADQPPPPELAPVIGGHLLDLVAAVLGPSRDAAETIERRGVRAARLRVILGAIARRFSDPGFNVGSLARAVGVSRRYVQDLLEETRKSFTEHVLERRLERAFTLLTDPRCCHLSIIDIAFATGFGDVSHFNRMLRRRHGDTPSGVRAAAARRNF